MNISKFRCYKENWSGVCGRRVKGRHYFRECLKMTSKQRPQWSEEDGHEEIWGKSIPQGTEDRTTLRGPPWLGQRLEQSE